MLKASPTEILSLVTLLYAIYLWCRNIFLLTKGTRTSAIVDRSLFYARIKYSVNGINITKQFFWLPGIFTLFGIAFYVTSGG